MPDRRDAEGDRPVGGILPDRCVPIVHQLISVVFELLSKVIQHRPGFVARRTPQAILASERGQRMSILEAAKDKNQQQQATRKTSPERNHLVLLSAKSQRQNYRRINGRHSNSLSILSDLTITLSVKVRAGNGFVGLVTRRDAIPQYCGKDKHSRCGHLVPLTQRTSQTAKTTREVRVDALIITFVRAVSRKNEKNESWESGKRIRSLRKPQGWLSEFWRPWPPFSSLPGIHARAALAAQNQTRGRAYRLPAPGHPRSLA